MGLKTRIREIQRQGLDWIVGHFSGIGLDERAESFVALFKAFIPQSAKVLDIGGGWGFYAGPLERIRGCKVTVLDVVEPGFRKVPVVTYEGDKIPFPDRSFEVSLLVTVLHHMPDPEKVLAEARRVTRGPVIVVEDLYHTSLGRFWTVLRDTLFNLEFVGHPRNFRSREGWRRTFQALGFKIDHEQKIYTWVLGIRILNGIFVLSQADG